MGSSIETLPIRRGRPSAPAVPSPVPVAPARTRSSQSVLESSPGHAATDQILGSIDRLRGRIEALVHVSGRNRDALHDLHRHLRGWREDHRLVREALGDDLPASSAALQKGLRNLRRLVREVRDLDEGLQLLLSPVAGRDASERGPLARFERTLEEAAHRRRLLIARNAASAQLADDLARYREELAERREALAAHLPEAADRLLRSTRKRIRRSFDRARAKPSEGRMHQLRIDLRRDRDLRTTARVVRPALAHLRPGTRRLLKRLGRLHDLEILDRALVRAGPEARYVRRGLRRQEASLRHGLAKELDRPRLARQLGSRDP